MQIDRRRWIRTVLICAAGCGLLAACAGREGPPRSLAPMWRDYLKMPDDRAFAVAGDPKRLWVGAAGGGYATREMAEDAVLAECARRRNARRMQEPCRLYATGDDVVW